MRIIVFDCSTHLGQFCTSNEATRIGCKNMKAAISEMGTSSIVGAWTDLENGRADRSIWNLPFEAQNDYYPLMDRFFSITNVNQEPISDAEEAFAVKLRETFPQLGLYSRYTCSRAKAVQADTIYTLIDELLSDSLVHHFQEHFGITITMPFDSNESSYADNRLEESYQRALETFKRLAINLPYQMADHRLIARP